MENFNHILLFKTNISTREDKEQIQILLDENRGIEQWNVDLDDEDFVLRIVSQVLNHEQVICLINDQGFECSKLI